jgi:hypothetical protein
MMDRTNKEKVWYTTTSRQKPRADDTSHAVSTLVGNLMAGWHDETEERGGHLIAGAARRY